MLVYFSVATTRKSNKLLVYSKRFCTFIKQLEIVIEKSFNIRLSGNGFFSGTDVAGSNFWPVKSDGVLPITRNRYNSFST